jgi:L-gulonate 3-dehydrogenase
MSKVAIIGSASWAVRGRSASRAADTRSPFGIRIPAPQTRLSDIESLLPDLETNDLLNGATAKTVFGRMRRAPTLEAALEGTIHVQENTLENVEVKREVFTKLDAAAPPDAVLASSTSAILPSKFTESLEGRSRCLVVHPINLPYLIPAAEVVPAPRTDADVVERTAALLRTAGHAPIVMKREIDGFVMNRLQGALLEEPFRLVADGYASVDDVDIAIRDGLALRWSFMGPFETIDLNAPSGVRDYAERYQKIYSGIFPSMQWRADWSGAVMDVIEAERRKRLPAGQLVERQSWRDRRLMALAAHKRRVDKDTGR